MKIVLNEPDSGTLLELDGAEVDIPSGTGWCVIMPKGRNVVIKFFDGEWKTDDESNISREFWQTIGNEITFLIGSKNQYRNSFNAPSSLQRRIKRPRLG